MAQSSHTTYGTQLKHWFRFVVVQNLNTLFIHNSGNIVRILRLFIAYLSLVGLAGSSIEVSLKAVSWFHHANGCTLDTTSPAIALVLRGAKNIIRSIPSTESTRGARLPLMAYHLRKIYAILRPFLNGSHSMWLEVWVAILLAWQGILRISEYTGSTENSLDFISNDRVLFKIQKSKTRDLSSLRTKDIDKCFPRIHFRHI